MAIHITAHFSFELDQPTDLLLQFEAAAIPEQTIISATTQIDKSDYFARVPAQDDIGERIWLRKEGRCQVEYSATVEIERLSVNMADLAAMEPHDLPGGAVQYLFDSRYCPADRFQPFALEEFGTVSGGAKIVAIRDWVRDHLTYEPGSSTPSTTALDTFFDRQGICRDYAHLVVTLARASGIPARYVSLYAPGVQPPDFHAVAEVFLADPTIPNGGAWHLVDATDMATPDTSVKIGIGRDAADVSFLTSFGPCTFGDKQIECRQG
ncbi:transglutaminase-like domain-containing protein [Altericroceibacterium endophyticum]|uniref:Transglutaminase family protein n=1 Tax=Altericroceibacterium endophyticum TaxID=1808508 RepID=A0A6I4TA16_9SPHN|nr:transglutaminase family protein [Altericroceibacterium endophyticum]MXO66605.1 transglutaminase family protein [Altericroceibacterium endophyticum]